MSGSKLFSSNQAAVGAFLGGPLAAVYFIYHNFVVLGQLQRARYTFLWGTVVVVLLLMACPFLPDDFPDLAIPVVTIAVTKQLVDGYQLKKTAIIAHPKLDFESNWLVFFISVMSLIIFGVLMIGLVFILAMSGVLDNV